MQKHEFLFTPGRWIGEGKITFSTSPDHLHFYTRWIIDEPKPEGIFCQQSVEMQNGEQNLNNLFKLQIVDENNFTIELENELVGRVAGKGIADEKTLAWEFRGSVLEGFEVYELQDNNDYMLHAEYASSEGFRTIIDGRIWRKSVQ